MVPLSSCRPSLLSPLASWSAIGHPKLIHVHLGGPLRHPSTLLGGPLLATIKGPTTVSAPRKGILRGAKTFLSLRDLDEKPQAWLLMTAGVSRVLSEHATFWRSFQLRQIQPLRGCSCTKRVPFRYHFDEKPPVIVAGTANRFSLARIQARAAGPIKPRPNGARNVFPQKSRLFWPPGPRSGEDAYLKPTNGEGGPFPPQETAPYSGIPPKHPRMRMFGLKSSLFSDVTGPSRHTCSRATAREPPEVRPARTCWSRVASAMREDEPGAERTRAKRRVRPLFIDATKSWALPRWMGR
jgi:hypothetical protein